ncbi:MAG: gliding motility-associated C-terminal domain-containing protein [Candidatus Kapabacteria bacterium]|nr:gliding motility-associated C-terminal domain-containing protein [Candidatus Kapabacteria bacterium]
MKYVKAHIIFFLLLSCPTIKAQNLFHQDIFYGGVTAGGFSTGQGSGSGTLNLYIEPGSTIRKAYLFSYRIGYPPSVPITVNSVPYLFDTLNCIMTAPHLNHPIAHPIKLYFYDITSDLNSSITSTFNITIPNQFGLPLNWSWLTAFLYIEYENPTLPKVATTVWINDKDFDYLLSATPYNMMGINPVNNSSPVGLSFFTDRIDNDNKVKVTFNSSLLGEIAYSDAVNSLWNYAGVKGHFYYQNNTLFGLDDDTANTTMNNSDGLADVSGFISNGATSYSIILENEYLPPNPIATYDRKGFNFLFINAYTTPCDTFSTNIIADTLICKGDSVQLFATGGTNYFWEPVTGLSNPNIANPTASPENTTLYVVRIENTPGCSRTEKVLVKVNEPPTINNITIEESVCGEDNGQITVIATGTNPLQYSIGSGFQSNNTFSNIAAGNYIVTVLDNNGCSSDTTVFVSEINPVNALFTTNPQTGTKPLFVDLNNQSSGTNNYNWFIDGNFLSNNFNETYTFDSSGVYTVTLIAYNNLPYCADTFSLQIIVYDSLLVQIPNVFTPNNDGINDIFSIKVEGVKQIKGIIINRWGNTIYEYSSIISDSPTTINLWDGYTQEGKKVSDGVYYYIIELTDMKDEIKKINGFVHVFK